MDVCRECRLCRLWSDSLVRGQSGIDEIGSWASTGESWSPVVETATGSVLIFCLPIMVSIENFEMSPFGFETKFVCWI